MLYELLKVSRSIYEGYVSAKDEMKPFLELGSEYLSALFIIWSFSYSYLNSGITVMEPSKPMGPLSSLVWNITFMLMWCHFNQLFVNRDPGAQELELEGRACASIHGLPRNGRGLAANVDCDDLQCGPLPRSLCWCFLWFPRLWTLWEQEIHEAWMSLSQIKSNQSLHRAMQIGIWIHEWFVVIDMQGVCDTVHALSLRRRW